MPNATAIEKMFGSIADRYDTANNWISGGVGKYWKYRLVNGVKDLKPETIIDLATGSGDVAFSLKKAIPQSSVIGMDFCQPMLDQAIVKQKKFPWSKDIEFVRGDCLALPFEDNSADVITIAYGYRNLESRKKGMEEFLRVLKPGGSLFILEFTQPYRIIRPFYYLYLKYILPKLAGIITKQKGAYDYLVGSIESFPNAHSLTQEILAAGFSHVSVKQLTLGVVAIHHAIN